MPIFAAALAVACAGASARAQPSPASPPAAGPDRVVLRGPVTIHTAADPAARREKGAYLGVSTSPAPQVLRQQLALPNGVGLVVDFVAPKGPAEEAGVQPLDVLHKLDDQVMVNQRQLAVLVRAHKSGDEVKLIVIRNGKPQTLTARLAEKDLPPLEDLRLGEVDQFSREMAELHDSFFDRGARPPLPPVNPAVGDKLGGKADGPDHDRLVFRYGPNEVIADALMLMFDDGKLALTLSGRDGHRHLSARIKGGKVLFDGSIDTDEQRQAVPKDVRDKLDQIHAFDRAGPRHAPLPAEAPSTRPADKGSERSPSEGGV